MQSTTGSMASDTGLTPLGTCSRGDDPPPGVACFVAALETGAWRREKRSRVRARFLERQNGGEWAALYNLPAREAIFFLCQGWHKFVEKQAEKSRKFLEGGRIDGEIMG